MVINIIEMKQFMNLNLRKKKTIHKDYFKLIRDNKYRRQT